MAHIWGETVSNIKRSGLVGLLSIIIVALTTMVFSILLVITNYIYTELDVLKESPFIVVFLNDGLDRIARENIQKKIESLPQVNSARYVSKEEALRRTIKIFADRKEILGGLEEINPLPSSFEVEINPQFLDSVKEVAEIFKGLPGVEDVQYAAEASMFVKSMEAIIIIIGSVLGLASIIIICFSIMLTAYVRRDEIRIMRLIGSTGSFIRLPLLLEGMVQGMTGSALGLLILYGLLNAYGTFNLLIMNISPFSFLTLKQIIMVVGLGTFIGFIGGAIPLRRLIKI